jgi:hypothetical protein
MNDELSEQDIQEIAERLRVIDAHAQATAKDDRFDDDPSVLEFLQETLAYAEQALQEVRRLRVALADIFDTIDASDYDGMPFSYWLQGLPGLLRLHEYAAMVGKTLDEP